MATTVVILISFILVLHRSQQSLNNRNTLISRKEYATNKLKYLQLYERDPGSQNHGIVLVGLEWCVSPLNPIDMRLRGESVPVSLEFSVCASSTMFQSSLNALVEPSPVGLCGTSHSVSDSSCASVSCGCRLMIDLAYSRSR